MKTKIIVATSGGKDATFALHQLRFNPAFSHFEVVGMMTTFCRMSGRSSAHRIRREVMEAQAEALGLPLIVVELQQAKEHYFIDYDEKIGQFYQQIKKQGIDHVMYGDLYLDDVKAYRDNFAEKHNIKTVYPLWQSQPQQLLNDLFSAGYKAMISAIDGQKIDQHYLGKTLSPELIASMPTSIDPCAEQGEYHTLCVDGPLFSTPLSLTAGEVSEYGGNYYIDLKLASTPCSDPI